MTWFICNSSQTEMRRLEFESRPRTFVFYASVHELVYSFTFNRTLYLNRPRLKMSKRNQNINKRARCIAVDRESFIEPCQCKNISSPQYCVTHYRFLFTGWLTGGLRLSIFPRCLKHVYVFFFSFQFLQSWMSISAALSVLSQILTLVEFQIKSPRQRTVSANLLNRMNLPNQMTKVKVKVNVNFIFVFRS